ncbi:hypothetical protein D3C84_1207280 [compost metagenome]
MATFGRCPVWVLVKQFDVQFVKATGGAHVDGVVLDLLDGGNASEWQQETKVVGQVQIVARDSFTRRELFSL